MGSKAVRWPDALPRQLERGVVPEILSRGTTLEFFAHKARLKTTRTGHNIRIDLRSDSGYLEGMSVESTGRVC